MIVDALRNKLISCKSRCGFLWSDIKFFNPDLKYTSQFTDSRKFMFYYWFGSSLKKFNFCVENFLLYGDYNNSEYVVPCFLKSGVRVKNVYFCGNYYSEKLIIRNVMSCSNVSKIEFITNEKVRKSNFNVVVVCLGDKNKILECAKQVWDCVTHGGWLVVDFIKIVMGSYKFAQCLTRFNLNNHKKDECFDEDISSLQKVFNRDISLLDTRDGVLMVEK